MVHIRESTLYVVGLLFSCGSAVGDDALNEHGNQRGVIAEYSKTSYLSRQGYGFRFALKDDFLR